MLVCVFSDKTVFSKPKKNRRCIFW